MSDTAVVGVAAPATGSEQKITPWEVEAAGGVDYEKLMRDFGAAPIDAALIERIERLTKRRAHVFLRRGLFYSHRDLSMILDVYEAGKPFYLYTGRGPSSDSLHYGPFGAVHVHQVSSRGLRCAVGRSDDRRRKVFVEGSLARADMHKFLRENVKDIVALGFDVQKTFIFSNFAIHGSHVSARRSDSAPHLRALGRRRLRL
jgi:tryptophanyl-tRNA synthetase